MPGRDLSADLYGNVASPTGGSGSTGSGRDLSSDLYGDAPAKPVGTLDRVRATVAGVNKGVFTGLLGLPVDTIANVLDLGKAAVGTVATAAGHPEYAPDLTDRAKVVGSSDWLARKINEVGLGAAINNPQPQDKVSRVLHSGGQVAGMSLVPSSELTAPAQLANMAKGGVSGIVGGTVGESYPEWAGLAGMLPQIAGAALPAATRAVVRGDEAGRQAMAQRISDLKAGGIDNPSVGLASGNKLVSGLENLLSHTPGSMGLYESAHAANVAGMRTKTERIRDAISPEYGPVVAGEAIQNDLKGAFRNRVNATTRELNDQVAQRVGPDFYTMPNNTLSAAQGMSSINPAAPATSTALQNRRIAGISSDLASDVQGTPIPGNSLMNQPPRYMRADGQVMDIPPGIPFGTLKNLRTSIGEEASSPAILGTPEGRQFKGLYGAMSQDMRQAAGAADRQNAGVDVGPLMASQQPASLALNRANTFYSRAATRAEDLNGIANRDTPEGAYGAVASSLKAGPTIYERLRGTITPEARQKVVATVVNDMGAAAPGQQNADGSAWSARAFLTNYNRLDPDARGALFTRLSGGQAYADNLSKVARAAEMMGDSAKVWANPSGTSHALAARGAVGAIGLGAVGGVFYAPLIAPAAAAAGTMIMANQVSQRLLLNPTFVNWLAKAPVVPTSTQMQAHAQRLIANAKLSGDRQFQQDATEYLNAIKGSEQ